MSSPLPPTTPTAPPLADPNGTELNRTLTRQLVPVADKLRNMLTTFGLRQYRIRILTIQWSGGTRGVGLATVVNQLDLLPTPKVMDLNAVQEIVNPVGLDEIGVLLVTQISAAYSEDTLLGRQSDGTPTSADQETLWEIEYLRPDGLQGDRRRFFVQGAPQLFPGRFQWNVRLERSHNDRLGDGTPDPDPT